MSAAMAETKDELSFSSIEVSSDEAEIDSADNPELLSRDVSNSNVAKQKKRSIKMIVGGQSEDGLAKQVTLPVGD